MVSKDVYNLIEGGEIKTIYSLCFKSFKWIDEWAEKMINGDILNEQELAFMIDKSTAIFSKLCPIVNALESYNERKLYNTEVSFLRKCEKLRTQDSAQAKAESRASVSDFRDYLGDFKGYLNAAQQNIVSAQSRIKRLTVEKSAKGVDFTGEVPNNT